FFGDLSQDGKQVAAIAAANTEGREGRLHIWNIANGNRGPDVQVEGLQLSGVRFLPKNRLWVETSQDRYDGGIQISDGATGELITSWTEPKFSSYKHAALSPDGTRIAVVSSVSPLLRVRELETGRLIMERKAHANRIDAVAFSPDGSRVMTVAAHGELKEW